jgi:SPP1 family phage portal protein
MAMPDRTVEPEEDESPFEIYTLDPRYTWVVYHSGLGEKPKVAFKYITKQDGTNVFSAYTDRMYYEIVDGNIVKAEPHTLTMIPIIEYPANNARLGSFEIVLSLLDALNEAESNRLDAVEQFVQSLLVFQGVDIDSEDFSALKLLGGIKIPPDGDVKYLVQEMNQSSTQTLVDDLYETILTICAVPSQSMSKQSDSSNNGAVILKNGWQSAEARAKDTELMFKQSEKVFLKLVLRISDTLGKMPLKVSDIEIRFTRRNYENIQSKAQVLCEMLASDKIHPKLAFSSCNLFPDAELAYTMSMEYWEERKKMALEELAFYEANEKEDQTQLGTAAEENGYGGADAGGYYENR